MLLCLLRIHFQSPGMVSVMTRCKLCCCSPEIFSIILKVHIPFDFRLYVSGWSAGGHLTATLLATDFTKYGLPQDIIKGNSGP